MRSRIDGGAWTEWSAAHAIAPADVSPSQVFSLPVGEVGKSTRAADGAWFA